MNELNNDREFDELFGANSKAFKTEGDTISFSLLKKIYLSSPKEVKILLANKIKNVLGEFK